MAKKKKQPRKHLKNKVNPRLHGSEVNEFSLSGRRRWGKEAEDDPGKCRRILECHGSAARKPNSRQIVCHAGPLGWNKNVINVGTKGSFSTTNLV